MGSLVEFNKLKDLHKDSVIKILILEPSVDDRSQLKTVFRQLAEISKWQMRLRFESDVKNFFRQIVDFEPKFVLISSRLGAFSPLEIIQQMSSNNMLLTSKVLLLTEKDQDELALSALTQGASDILTKPLRRIDLALKLAKLLELEQATESSRAIRSKLQREKETLGRFFSADLMDLILTDETYSELGGINTMASVMMFDLRGSTALAEKMGPMAFAELLGQIFSEITAIIYRNCGSINKFMGDGLVATFGCPVFYGNDAYNCVKAAKEIEEFFEDYNAKIGQESGEIMRFGIGISTGRLFAGNIGSEERMEYTVLGDSVNIASRLESLSKNVSSNILLDQNTLEQLGSIIEVTKKDFSYVRGRIGEIFVYALKDIDYSLAEKEYLHTNQVQQNDIDKKISEVEFF